MIEWLQNWYTRQCDGKWEHEYGIKIETLDNPGWSIVIDLKNTELEKLKIPYSLNEKTDEDWFGYSIENGVFKAAGGAQSLSVIIELFKGLIDSNVGNDI